MLLVSDLSPWLVRSFAFVWGALWGSFFNVAVYRWPREMSVVEPPSHCPACGKRIPWYRNVPLVAYLLQRGRAACCGARMSARYLGLEVLTGLLAVAVFEVYVVRADSVLEASTATVEALLFFFFVGGLVVATFIDLDWMEIPDEVSIGGTAFGLATITFRPHGPSLEEVALGVGAGYLVIFMVFTYAIERMIGRRGMGEGDAKLMMFIGAFLGWKGAAFALLAGATQGTLVALVLRITGRSLIQDRPLTEEDEADEEGLRRMEGLVPPRPWPPEGEPEDEGGFGTKMPFGPFLALAAAEYLFFGPDLINWYLRLLGVEP